MFVQFDVTCTNIAHGSLQTLALYGRLEQRP